MPTRPPVVSFKRAATRSVDPVNYGARRVDAKSRSGPTPYNSHWRKSRSGFLQKHPMCALSAVAGERERGANVIDHWYPHLGLHWLFWYRPLWVPMHKAVHDGLKQRLENQGEDVLDIWAVKLGLTPLYQLEPVRVHEWRKAWSDRMNNAQYRGGY